MKETVKDKFIVEAVGVPSIAELSTEDKKAFALALLSCAIEYYKEKTEETDKNN